MSYSAGVEYTFESWLTMSPAVMGLESSALGRRPPCPFKVRSTSVASARSSATVHCSFGRCEKPEAGNEEFACENGDDDPSRDVSSGAEKHEAGAHQDLVDERVHEFAELGPRQCARC